MIVSHRVPNPVPRAYLPEGAGSPQRPNRCLVNTRYDAAGNRLRKVDGGSPTTWTYDSSNQIIRQLDSTGPTTFLFDANGKPWLIRASVHNALPSATPTTIRGPRSVA